MMATERGASKASSPGERESVIVMTASRLPAAAPVFRPFDKSSHACRNARRSSRHNAAMTYVPTDLNARIERLESSAPHLWSRRVLEVIGDAHHARHAARSLKPGVGLRVAHQGLRHGARRRFETGLVLSARRRELGELVEGRAERGVDRRGGASRELHRVARVLAEGARRGRAGSRRDRSRGARAPRTRRARTGPPK